MMKSLVSVAAFSLALSSTLASANPRERAADGGPVEVENQSFSDSGVTFEYGGDLTVNVRTLDAPEGPVRMIEIAPIHTGLGAIEEFAASLTIVVFDEELDVPNAEGDAAAAAVGQIVTSIQRSFPEANVSTQEARDQSLGGQPASGHVVQIQTSTRVSSIAVIGTPRAEQGPVVVVLRGSNLGSAEVLAGVLDTLTID